jgi:hypothetical protein
MQVRRVKCQKFVILRLEFHFMAFLKTKTNLRRSLRRSFRQPSRSTYATFMLNFRKANIWIRRLIGTELVDLYVGPEKQHFRVHKKILVHRVPHFKTVKSQVFIPKHIPPVFDMLIRWIYNNTLPVLKRGALLNDSMFWKLERWPPLYSC